MPPSKRPNQLALKKALAAAHIPDTDGAAVALAKRYAYLLDTTTDVDTLAKLGPKYQAVLTALGLTKAGRTVSQDLKTHEDAQAKASAAASEEGGGDDVTTAGGTLHQLRGRHRGRTTAR